jgi:hypothetical protein
MDIISFIPEQLLILVAALNVIGFACNNYPKVKNDFIPPILFTLGIVFSISMQGISPGAILQGILCAGASMGLYDAFKPLKNKDN